jgi:2-polyprenyl-3-methyl-5-hydroxy-6-metoxy-1,4-benzoquinol methylase
MPEHSDQNWQSIGEVDAYYGVLTYDQYTHDQLDPEKLAVFFQTGEAHCQRIFEIIRQRLKPAFSPQRGLDFGCGVGRILIPLAQVCNEVVGVDVAESMLAEARKNCAERAITNVTLLQSDDRLTELTGSFDFMHSYIVFQHIPRRRGEQIFEKMLSMLEEDGVGAVHFVFQRQITRSRRIFQWLKQNFSVVNGLVNLLFLKQPYHYPALQMHEYPLSPIFRLLQVYDCHQVYAVFSEHASPYTTANGVMLFFVKKKVDPLA